MSRSLFFNSRSALAFIAASTTGAATWKNVSSRSPAIAASAVTKAAKSISPLGLPLTHLQNVICAAWSSASSPWPQSRADASSAVNSSRVINSGALIESPTVESKTPEMASDCGCDIVGTSTGGTRVAPAAAAAATRRLNLRTNSPSFSRRSLVLTANPSKFSRNAAPTAAASAPLSPATSASASCARWYGMDPVLASGCASASRRSNAARSAGGASSPSGVLAAGGGAGFFTDLASDPPTSSSSAKDTLTRGLALLGLGLALLNPIPGVLPDPPRFDPKLESPDDDDVPKEPMEARALNGRAPGVFAAGCGATVGSMTGWESLSGIGSDFTAAATESKVTPSPACATTAPNAFKNPRYSSLRSFLPHALWKHSCACC